MNTFHLLESFRKNFSLIGFISLFSLGLGTATASQTDFEKKALKKAKDLIKKEFKDSTLSKEDQLKELEWFIKTSKPFRGMKIQVVSESIDTHSYESKTLAKAFTELTGIELTHDLIGEGDVIEKLQTQMHTGRNIYDMYVNDSDLIGTHSVGLYSSLK